MENSEYEIENVNLTNLSYEELQEIFCKKIANVIIKMESWICMFNYFGNFWYVYGGIKNIN